MKKCENKNDRQYESFLSKTPAMIEFMGFLSRGYHYKKTQVRIYLAGVDQDGNDVTNYSLPVKDVQVFHKDAELIDIEVKLRVPFETINITRADFEVVEIFKHKNRKRKALVLECKYFDLKNDGDRTFTLKARFSRFPEVGRLSNFYTI